MSVGRHNTLSRSAAAEEEEEERESERREKVEDGEYEREDGVVGVWRIGSKKKGGRNLETEGREG